MTVLVYETNEIEVQSIRENGSVHFDVIVPNQFDRAEQLGILDQAQTLWTDEVIAAYEQRIELLKQQRIEE